MSSTRLPSISNGFTLRVVGRDTVKGRKEYHLIEELSRMDVSPKQMLLLLEKMRGTSLNNLD